MGLPLHELSGGLVGPQPWERECLLPHEFVGCSREGLLLSFVGERIARALGLVQQNPYPLPTYLLVNLFHAK